MYFRFVLPWRHPESRVEAGLFHGAYDAARDAAVDPWLRTAMRRELDWFDCHLPLPGRIVLGFKRRRPIHGVCWFRPEAGAAIARARHLAWLMGEAGRPVREIRSRAPGEILWSDGQQIVAKPPRFAWR